MTKESTSTVLSCFSDFPEEKSSTAPPNGEVYNLRRGLLQPAGKISFRQSKAMY